MSATIPRPSLEALNSKQKYAVMGSLFLGPKAENRKILDHTFKVVIDEIERGRKKYFKDDPESITHEMIENEHAEASVSYLTIQLRGLARLLAKHSIPFFSPRYAAHMNSDIALPGILGYLAAILFNQNNVAPEGGPMTTVLEREVGEDLCKMLGYGSESWGHLTSGGSVSNLESMWVARNLKYYPLSLRNAMLPGNPLAFASTLEIILCTGEKKSFGACTTWELLNLTPEEILDLPAHLTTQFRISSQTLEKILEVYSVQSVGKGKLDQDFEITYPPQYFISPANHYSWGKSSAITGIGRENLSSTAVDLDARMDTQDLRSRLNDCLKRKQAVYAVVVIVGSTEHGTVDPISEVLEIRREYQAKGLSFMVHADAAWGGYFATNIRDWSDQSHHSATSNATSEQANYAFALPLSQYTNEQLFHLRFIDSITVDAHKSGYIPYPAGGLCYRDSRLKFLVTWTSPVLNVDPSNEDVMGIYAVEGSKPGAAAAAVWLSHRVIGLDVNGYGNLLGTAMLTSVKIYMHWATMSLGSKTIIVTPFKMLPAERKNPVVLEEVEREKKGLLNLLKLRNHELESRKDELIELGSDLVVNAFACNFYIDGKPNKDVAEANILNSRIYKKLSIRHLTDNVHERPIIVMSTTFQHQTYGSCLANFKSRLGLDSNDDEDLVVLSNVSMSPFPAADGLVDIITAAFKQVAENEIQNMLKYRYPRWKISPDIHAFLLQGTDVLHLVYLPNFFKANHQRQVILSGRLDSTEAMDTYRAAHQENSNEPLVIFTTRKEVLLQILKDGSFIGDIYHGRPERYQNDKYYKPVCIGVKLSFIKIIKNRPLDRQSLDKTYMEKVPFYLYGTPMQQHIDHILLCAPNVQLTASNVMLQLNLPLSDQRMVQGLAEGLIIVLDGEYENVKQPFGEANEPSFFAIGAVFQIKVYEDRRRIDDPTRGIVAEFHPLPVPLTTGSLVLCGAVKLYQDYNEINSDVIEEEIAETNTIVSAREPAGKYGCRIRSL